MRRKLRDDLVIVRMRDPGFLPKQRVVVLGYDRSTPLNALQSIQLTEHVLRSKFVIAYLEHIAL